MKRSVKIFAALALVLAAACNKAPSVKLGSDILSVPFAGGNAEMPVSANCDWSAVSEADWIFVNTKNGDENVRSLVLTIDPNMVAEERTGLVKVSAEGVEKSFSVVQGAKSVIVMDGNSSIELTAEKQTFEVNVGSNVEFDATPDVPWLRVVSSKALNTSTFVFEADSNEGTFAREGSIAFTDRASNVAAVFSVRQSGVEQYVRITHTGSEFVTPALFGADGFGLVDWGDGSSDSNRYTVTHVYDQPGEHVVTVSSFGATKVSLSDVKGVTCIDVWDF